MAPANASEVLEFVVVVGSLQLSYLIWGVMQETIMHKGASSFAVLSLLFYICTLYTLWCIPMS